MAFSVCVWGHSFVRRMHVLIENGRLPRNLSFDVSEFDILVEGFGGLTLTHRRLHSRDSSLQDRHLVILDIGSNDLCDRSVVPEQFALNLMSYASFLITGLDVRSVVILQLLPRGIEPYAGYNRRVISANVALQALVKTTDFSIYFWRHRGMWKCDDSIYCPDGVHLSPVSGYQKYVRSLRSCILRLKNWSS